MERRTAKQVEADFKKIQKIIETTAFCSFAELADAVKLSEAQVRTSLEKHPRVYQKIKKQIEENRREKCKEREMEKATNTEAVAKEISEPVKVPEAKFVVDASICGIEKFDEIVQELTESGGILFTSVTVRELDNLQKGKDKDALDARRILARAAKEFFQVVKISENFQNPDDNIIEYCRSERKVLITADKVMALKARAEGVEVRFVEQRKNKNNDFTAVQNTGRRVMYNNCTLASTCKIGKNLYITTCINHKRCVRVFTAEGSVMKNGLAELRRGDRVLIMTRKGEYITFSDYEIARETERDNANNIFHARLYKKEDIVALPDERYVDLAKEFFAE